MGSSPTFSAKNLIGFTLLHSKLTVIIKKNQSLKGKTLIEILFNIGFKKQEKGLRTLYFRNRKEIYKIGICVAKKKIRNSVERNILKRRIRIAYKTYSKNIIFLQKNLIIFFLEKKKFLL